MEKGLGFFLRSDGVIVNVFHFEVQNFENKQNIIAGILGLIKSSCLASCL